MWSSSTPFLSKDANTQSCSLYDHDDTDDTNDAVEPERNHGKQRHTAWNILTCLLAAWGIVSLVWYAIRVVVAPQPLYTADVYRPETLVPGLNLCDCGRTIEEALSRNCVYDSLSTSWLPPHCRDDDLTANFDRAGPGPEGQWSYFADDNGTIPLTRTDIAALGEAGGSFWCSRDWHIAHCVFYWQKYKRMRETGTVMEQRFDSLKHVEHCSRLILAPSPNYFFLIEVPVRMNGSLEEHPTSTRISGKLPKIPR